jgi:radical SAM protein with 4Fe4S-binding SPASM domain
MFPEILRTTRADYGIVPNYTTNGRGLDDCVLRATAKYCGAVAVSAYAPYEETEAAVEKLARNDIAATVHFVLSSRSIDTAITWLKDPPRFLRTARAIVFLNYKPVGRVVDETSLLGRSPRLDEFFDLATADDSLVRVGFDTCTISGVAGLGRVHRSSLEACDAGRFSLFVSERMEVFPCSFMLEAGYRGVSLRDKPMAEIWRDHPSFEKMRNRQPETRCRDCWAFSECLSGCPLFPEVNLCGATGLRGRPSGEIL